METLKPADLDDLRTAVRVVQAYLDATKFMDHIDLAILIPPEALKDSEAKYQAVRKARQAVRDKLDEIRNADLGTLAQLVAESAALVQNPCVNVSAFIDHLQEAHDILRNLKSEDAPLDDLLIAQLVDNWEVAVKQLDETRIAVGNEHERRAAVAHTLQIHDLLEEIYSFLTEVVSVEAQVEGQSL